MVGIDLGSTYFAHSGTSLSGSDWQSLRSHLYNVSQIANQNARFFNGQQLAEMAGWLHDLGKYTPEFQKRLTGANIRVDHATAGAKIAYEKWGVLGKILAFCIAFNVSPC